MAHTMQLDIVTPEGTTYSGKVDSVILPAWEGSLGVLYGHEPMVALLTAGEMRFRLGDKEELLALSGGFCEIEPTKVVVLAETAEMAGQIDLARAKAKADQKQQAIRGAHLLSEEQAAQMQGSLAKEIIRLKVAQKAGKPG